jgi:hypothetical protein
MSVGTTENAGIGHNPDQFDGRLAASFAEFVRVGFGAAQVFAHILVIHRLAAF